MKPFVHQCSFVRASDVFENYPHAWAWVCNEDPPFTWGDNSHSMVSIDAILHYLENSGLTDDNRFEEFRQWCLAIGRQRYVDLES